MFNMDKQTTNNIGWITHLKEPCVNSAYITIAPRDYACNEALDLLISGRKLMFHGNPLSLISRATKLLYWRRKCFREDANAPKRAIVKQRKRYHAGRRGEKVSRCASRVERLIGHLGLASARIIRPAPLASVQDCLRTKNGLVLLSRASIRTRYVRGIHTFAVSVNGEGIDHELACFGHRSAPKWRVNLIERWQHGRRENGNIQIERLVMNRLLFLPEHMPELID
jgi:hypothetical protein